MIVSQSQGNLMMVPPNFFVEYNDTANVVNITFNVVNITGVMQKTTAAGFGTYPIQTEFREISTNTVFTDVRNITITTKYSNTWFALLNSSLMAANLNTTQFLLTDAGQTVTVEFLSVAPTVNLIFNMIEIRAQIGPGLVE